MSYNEQMDEGRENIENVLADFRQYLSNTKIPPEVAEAIACYLDRIKAAANRERETIETNAIAVGGIVEAAPTAEKSSAVGNAAAMREAMEKAKKAICHHAAHICQSLSWENSNIQSNCADVLCAHRELCEAKTAINAALAAPPRVCDVNTLESLSDFIEKTMLTSDLLKDAPEIVKSVAMASARTALTVAYDPANSELKQRKGETDEND